MDEALLVFSCVVRFPSIPKEATRRGREEKRREAATEQAL